MEDDSEIASLYSLVLQERGHKVTLALTAEDCLKIYSKSLRRGHEKEIFSKVFNLMMLLFLIIKCQTETELK